MLTNSNDVPICLSNLPQIPQSSMTDARHATLVGWLCGTVVERWSLAGVLSLSHAQPVADG